MSRLQRPSNLTTPKNLSLLSKQPSLQPQPDIHTQMRHRDVYCAVLFLLYMIAMLVFMGLALYNGNYTKIGAVVDESNEQCGKGVNVDYPYLMFTDPCDGMLARKVCVSVCVGDNGTAAVPMCNSTRCSNTLSLFTDCSASGCSYYDSYPYLQKICLPTSSTSLPLIQSNLQNYPIDISLSNLSETYTYLLIIGSGVVLLTMLSFLLFLACPKIIYCYIAVTFLGLLFLAFFMMKISQLAVAAAQTSYTSIVTTDQEKTQIISLVIFGCFFMASPVVMFGYRRVNFAIKLINALKCFFRRMVTLHFFNLLLTILILTFYGFQVFVLCNLYTYGTALLPSSTSSPFYSFSNDIIGLPIAIFQIIGTYWIFTFLTCYSQFIVSCNLYIWFFEQTEELPAFSPLRRSLGKSMYHLGSIAMDGFLIPVTWVLLVVYEFLREGEDDGEEEESKEGMNACAKFFVKIWRKFVYFFQLLQNYLNRGSYCSMVQKNTPFFQSNRLYSHAIKQKTRNLSGLGTHLSIFCTLFIVTVTLITSYFVMYFLVEQTSQPPKISSLAVPLSIMLLLSLAVGSVFGSVLGYSTDSLIYYHVTLQGRVRVGRKAYEVEEFLNEV